MKTRIKETLIIILLIFISCFLACHQELGAYDSNFYKLKVDFFAGSAITENLITFSLKYNHEDDYKRIYLSDRHKYYEFLSFDSSFFICIVGKHHEYDYPLDYLVYDVSKPIDELYITQYQYHLTDTILSYVFNNEQTHIVRNIKTKIDNLYLIEISGNTKATKIRRQVYIYTSKTLRYKFINEFTVLIILEGDNAKDTIRFSIQIQDKWNKGLGFITECNDTKGREYKTKYQCDCHR